MTPISFGDTFDTCAGVLVLVTPDRVFEGLGPVMGVDSAATLFWSVIVVEESSPMTIFVTVVTMDEGSFAGGGRVAGAAMSIEANFDGFLGTFPCAGPHLRIPTYCTQYSPYFLIFRCVLEHQDSLTVRTLSSRLYPS